MDVRCAGSADYMGRPRPAVPGGEGVCGSEVLLTSVSSQAHSVVCLRVVMDCDPNGSSQNVKALNNL
jgi:hypothetical protein